MNNDESEFETITSTAIILAHLRAVTDIPYCKRIAALTEATKSFKILVPGIQDTDTVSAMAELRYKAVDAALKKAKTGPIIELAAGLSPRGIIWAEKGHPYAEIDLPANHAAKMLAVHALRNGIPANLHLLSGNALDRSTLARAVEQTAKGRPVAIICEGLLTYLSMDEKSKLLKNIRSVLALHGGVFITPDITTKEWMNDLGGHSRPMAAIVSSVNALTKRSLFDNAFESFEQAKAFFEKRGFGVARTKEVDLVQKLSAAGGLGTGVLSPSMTYGEVWVMNTN